MYFRDESGKIIQFYDLLSDVRSLFTNDVLKDVSKQPPLKSKWMVCMEDGDRMTLVNRLTNEIVLELKEPEDIPVSEFLGYQETVKSGPMVNCIIIKLKGDSKSYKLRSYKGDLLLTEITQPFGYRNKHLYVAGQCYCSDDDQTMVTIRGISANNIRASVYSVAQKKFITTIEETPPQLGKMFEEVQRVAKLLPMDGRLRFLDKDRVALNIFGRTFEFIIDSTNNLSTDIDTIKLYVKFYIEWCNFDNLVKVNPNLVFDNLPRSIPYLGYNTLFNMYLTAIIAGDETLISKTIMKKMHWYLNKLSGGHSLSGTRNEDNTHES